MIEGKYEILMRTPLGAKKGSLELQIVDGKLNGVLEVMGGKNSFENGEVEGDTCKFSGVIKTPMGKVEYETEGKVEGDTITATSKTKKGTFQISGKRI